MNLQAMTELELLQTHGAVIDELVRRGVDHHGIEDVKYKTHDAVVETFKRLRDRPAIAFGDTNSGRRGADEASAYFNKREDDWYERIESAGWVDVWRSRHPADREYTWHTGSGADAGFRLDQVFATRSTEPRITNIRYDWGDGGRAAKLSDHAAIVFEIHGGSSDVDADREAAARR